MASLETSTTSRNGSGLDRVWDEKQDAKNRQVSNLRRSLILAHPAAIAYFKYVDAVPIIPKFVFSFFLFGLFFSALSEGVAGIIAWYEARSINNLLNDRLNDQLNGSVREDVFYAVRYSERTQAAIRRLKVLLTVCWSLSGILFLVGVLIPAVLLILSLCNPVG